MVRKEGQEETQRQKRGRGGGAERGGRSREKLVPQKPEVWLDFVPLSSITGL